MPFFNHRCDSGKQNIKIFWIPKVSFFHSDKQPELNLKNDYPNTAGYNIKTNSSVSIL